MIGSSVLTWLLALLIPLLSILALLVAAHFVLRSSRARWPRVWRAWKKLRIPFGASLFAVAARTVVRQRRELDDLQDGLDHLLTIVVIAAVIWLLATLSLYALSLSERRLLQRLPSDRDRRRAKTQVGLIRRLLVVAFVLIGAAMILLTFDGMDRIGAGILASAGLLSVVAGLAAQSSLANLFAGIQLAFSDALRIDDVVVVEGEWGWIEDVTLTYVVVRIWDDRRLILPSTYFTTTPFTNWTRTGEQIIGQVLFHLDWRTDVERLRTYFDEIMAETPLWDRRSGSVRVTDAVDGVLTVRVVVSAADSDDLFLLQCLVREKFASWLREHNPEALPQQRVQMLPPADMSGREPSSD